MSDRASVMKSFDTAFSDKRKAVTGTDKEMEFLHCNAHFLLGLSHAINKVLKEWEEKKVATLQANFSHGHQLVKTQLVDISALLAIYWGQEEMKKMAVETPGMLSAIRKKYLPL